MTKQIPPHNLDAEKSLISTCIIDNNSFEYCLDLNPSEFYERKHQVIFKAMLNLQAKRVNVDLVTLANELQEQRELNEIGIGYLSLIADSSPLAMNTEAYVNIISDMAIKRKAIQIGSQLITKGYMNGDVAELIDYAQSETMQLQQSKRGDKIFQVSQLTFPHIENIKKTVSTEKERSLLLGFPRIDSFLNIEGAKLIVVAGRPAMGKTAFAVTCMRNLTRLGVNCGFLSIEMGQDEILNR